jgi:hypothetical protein
MSEHDFQTSCLIGGGAATADALQLRSQQGSRRTVESAGGHALANVSQVGGKPLADSPHGLYRDYGGKNAGKKGVQRATAISAAPAVVAVMMGSFLATVVIAMVIVDVGSDRGWQTLRDGQR